MASSEAGLSLVLLPSSKRWKTEFGPPPNDPIWEPLRECDASCTCCMRRAVSHERVLTAPPGR
eukprot:scaffold11187_cov30-Tisochrysis_lutea.AAC.9